MFFNWNQKYQIRYELFSEIKFKKLKLLFSVCSELQDHESRYLVKIENMDLGFY